jgi:hypothetical protein
MSHFEGESSVGYPFAAGAAWAVKTTGVIATNPTTRLRLKNFATGYMRNSSTNKKLENQKTGWLQAGCRA